MLIGGFIITGNIPKRVIIRGIGPSLRDSGLTDMLEDPTLQLFGTAGQIAFNDDWRDLQEGEIAATQIAPTDDREPAIIATLNPDSYTAVISGKGGTTGVGLLEVFDLNASLSSKLANISTRGSVETEDNVMIGGFILGGNSMMPSEVVVRALGPSLAQSNIADPLANPTLQLFNSNGVSVAFDDNWQDDTAQADRLQALGIAPAFANEAAIVLTLTPDSYTAVVAGQGGTTGVGLIEVYDVQ